MAETATPRGVNDYLAQLDIALADVADETARDIRSGVLEELTGLDAATAAVRIQQLGDPFFIAAQAREAGGDDTTRVVNQPAPGELRPMESRPMESRGLIVLTAILVAIGGVIVPILGWIIGIVLVWVSKAWTRGEKWCATLAPFVGGAVYSAVMALVQSATKQPKIENQNEFNGPDTSQFGACHCSASCIPPSSS